MSDTETSNLTIPMSPSLNEDFKSYKEQIGETSNAAAGRRLLRKGYEAETGDAADKERPRTAADIYAEEVPSFAGTATLFALFATVVWFVSPALLAAEIVFWFWVVAGVSNLATWLASRRGWFSPASTGRDRG